jgi:putative Mn2+ efflux pump MntP
VITVEGSIVVDYATVLLVSVALGIDAFSVAIGLGLMGVKLREILLVSGVVSIFHVFMPLTGLYLGSYLGSIAGPVASLIGAMVLVAIGLNICWESIRDMGWLQGVGRKADGGEKAVTKGNGLTVDFRNPVSLMVMAGSVSLDALSVGFGLGTLKVDLWLTVITMGIVAGLMTATGMAFGKGLHKIVGEKAGILSGIILVVIGLRILIS